MANRSYDVKDFNSSQFSLCNWLVFSSALLVTGLRLFIQLRTLKRLSWDDVFAIAAIASLLIMALLNEAMRSQIYMIILVTQGQDPRIPAQDIPDQIIYQEKVQFWFMMFFWTCLWSVKGSLLMFYRRLFTGVQGYMIWWWIVAAFCILTWMISILTNVMDCLPLRRRFSVDPKDACPKSSGINSIWVATSIDIASDILIMLLPIRLLIGLRISLKHKIGLGTIFGLGFVIIIFSIIRMVYVLNSITNSDATGSVSLAVWSMLETSIAVIVGSMPSLKSLIHRRRATSLDYSSGPNHQSSTRNTGRATSKIGTSRSNGHIRLYDLNNEQSSHTNNTIVGGFKSSEVLHRGLNDGFSGITKTQEVTITTTGDQSIAPTETSSFENLRPEYGMSRQ